MDLRIATIIVFDAVNYGATLFLISVGLTVVYGVLRILNVAHGGIYALGAYMFLSGDAVSVRYRPTLVLMPADRREMSSSGY